MIQHDQITFGQSLAATLTLTTSEQFSNQIGISEVSQHDLCVAYAPTDTSAGVNLQTFIYISHDGMAVAASDSTWFPYCRDLDDGNGNNIGIKNSYYQSAPVPGDQDAERNPARSFSVGAKKIRFGFLEVGSPATAGVITGAFLSSREV